MALELSFHENFHAKKSIYKAMRMYKTYIFTISESTKLTQFLPALEDKI